MERKRTRRIMVGRVPVGGGTPVSIQSMTKTDTRDAEATSRQIAGLAAAGCEIVRVAVPDRGAAEALGEICRRSPLPVIADVHFDHRLALAAAEAGAAGLRINPGNIGAAWKVKEVVRSCRERNLPIRVGANEGSLSRDLEEKHGGPTPEALVESALKEVAVIEREGYGEIKISVKAFDVFTSRDAYRLLSAKTDYPLHVGITEAGPEIPGTVRSAIGISMLLLEGIGDTVRVSLTADPLSEVRVAKEILQTLGLRSFGPLIVSCPTCGRTRIDLPTLVAEVEAGLAGLPGKERLAGLRVAVMGCEVNGPGEARRAEVGIAGGRGSALLFRQGVVIGRYPIAEAVPALLAELESGGGR